MCFTLGANSLTFYDLFRVFISLLVGISLNTLIWMLGVAANETRLADAEQKPVSYLLGKLRCVMSLLIDDS